MRNCVPAGWEAARLEDVSAIRSGYGFPKRFQGNASGELPFFKVGDISRSVQANSSSLREAGHYISRAQAEELKARTMPAGTTVFAKIGEAIRLNRRAILAQESLVDNNVMGLVPNPDAIDPTYLLNFMYTVRLGELSQATTVPSVRKSDVAEIDLPIAPLPEQRRIVEAIESYLTRLDDAVASLERVQRNLERYRASVLKAAVEGRLVPTEAELARRENRSYEPASVLLERILAERKTRWIEDAAEKALAKGITDEDALLHARTQADKKYKEPEAPDITDLPNLPEGWCWATVESVSQLVTDGDHNPPGRIASGIPHLTAKHVKNWEITTRDCTYVSPAGFEKTRTRYEPMGGDLIVTCVGTVGECAVVPEGLLFSADRNLAAIRLASGEILAEFLLLVMSTPGMSRTLRGLSGSTAQPHLYLGDLRRLPIPLPPIAEQLRIAEAIFDRSTQNKRSDDDVARVLRKTAGLRQSVLKWAFEGKLVEQDPNDEPASMLLEQIRAEREAGATAGPARRRKKGATT